MQAIPSTLDSPCVLHYATSQMGITKAKPGMHDRHPSAGTQSLTLPYGRLAGAPLASSLVQTNSSGLLTRFSREFSYKYKGTRCKPEQLQVRQPLAGPLCCQGQMGLQGQPQPPASTAAGSSTQMT